MEPDATVPACKRSVGIVLLAALSVGATCLSACAPKISDGVVVRTDAPALARMIQEDKSGTILLIDTRPSADFRAGTIGGAVNMRLGDVESDRREPALTRYSELIVFGQNPGDVTAMAMAKRLLTAGYGDVLLFEAGVDGWVGAGMRLQPGGAGPAAPR